MGENGRERVQERNFLNGLQVFLKCDDRGASSGSDRGRSGCKTLPNALLTRPRNSPKTQLISLILCSLISKMLNSDRGLMHNTLFTCPVSN